MEQKRSRLVAPDATGLRARILSTGGLLVVAGMVIVVLVLLYPRQELIDRLQTAPRNDELSLNYLSNLLGSEPDNDELRLLLAERYFALKQTDRADTVLQPMMRKVLPSDAMTLRRSRLALSLQESRTNAAMPGSAEAQAERARLVAGLEERVGLPWSTPELLELARKATALEQLPLAERYYGRVPLVAGSGQAEWFGEAVRTAIWARNYTGAAAMHERALAVSDSLPAQRAHLREALTILQSGNLLEPALAMAERHNDIIGTDAEFLRYMTRLSLAANRPDVAQGYARRLMQMSALPPALRVPLGWLAAVVDLVVTPARAAEAVGDKPAAAAAPQAGPQPGDPRLPYDEATYNLAYQTFLANRNQNDAWRVAAAAVRQLPSDVVWRERLAQVSEWTGKPEEALVHWRALSQLPGADRATVDRALQSMLRLAPGLNDDEVLLSTWKQVGAQRRLTSEEILGVLALQERLGRPEEGMKWLIEADRRQPSAALLEARVDLAERMGDVPGTIEALQLLIRRAGMTPERAMRLATLHGRRGETAKAYEVLAPLASKVPASNQDYWRLLANLAWSLQVESQALQALRVTTDWPGGLNSYDANRLLSLLTPRDPREAARFAERAWTTLKEPVYLQAALNLWWNAQETGEVDRLFGSVTPDVEKRLTGDPYFWMLRSQWRQSHNEMPAALADMRRSLAAQPDHVDTRVAFLFMLMDARANAELARTLAAWLPEARRDPAYDAAFGAGYMALEQPVRALPFWRRQVLANRNDPMWAASYADVLEGSGASIEARNVRQHALLLTRQRLQSPAGRDAVSPAVMQSLRLQLARLMLDISPPGDAQRRAVHELTGPAGLMSGAMSRPTEAAARELALGWMLSNEAHDQARLWLWRRYGRKVVTPAWAEMSLALNDGDVATVREMLSVDDGQSLPPMLRADALQTAGQTARAQSLRIAQLTLHDDDSQHEAYSDMAWRENRRIEYGLDLTRDAVDSVTHSLTLWLPWTEQLRAGVAWQRAQQSVGAAGADGLPQIGRMASNDQSMQWLLQYRPERTLRLDAALGVRAAERTFPTLSLSGTYDLIPRLQLRADLGLNTRAADTAGLAVAGLQQELRLGAALRLSQTDSARVGLRAARLGLQGNDYLGAVGSLEWELGHTLRNADPMLGVRLFGQYSRYSRGDAALPAWTARLTPDGSQPGSAFFVPDSFALHGVGLNFGLADRDAYTRAWRPFFDLSLTTHSRLGAGHGLTVGVAGRLLGSDQLLLQYSSTRSGATGNARTLGLRYILPF